MNVHEGPNGRIGLHRCPVPVVVDKGAVLIETKTWARKGISKGRREEGGREWSLEASRGSRGREGCRYSTGDRSITSVIPEPKVSNSDVTAEPKRACSSRNIDMKIAWPLCQLLCGRAFP